MCASVARLVSGVVWYSEAPRPRVARRRSSRPGRVGVCCFKLHWWIAWRARDFRLIGDWVSTEHSGRVRPLCSNIRYVASVESAEGQSGGPCGVGRARGAVAGAARDPRRNPNRDRVAGCPATERRFINQALYSSLVRSGGRARRVSHARSGGSRVRSYPIALWCLLFQHVTVGQAKYHSHPAAPTVLGSLPLAPTLTAHQD